MSERQPWGKYLGFYFAGMIIVVLASLAVYTPDWFSGENQITAAAVVETQPEPTIDPPEAENMTESVENSSDETISPEG